MPNQLTYLTAVGYVYDVEQPNPSGITNVPSELKVSAYVDFYPGTQAQYFQPGFTVFVSNLDHLDGTSGDTEVPIAPITGRLMNGALSAIAVGDPPGVELLAYTAMLNLASPLYYHVRWRNVTFGGATQAISNFAFAATPSTKVAGLGTTPSATGGTLAGPATRYYGVTAKLAGIETLVCTAVSAAVPSGSTGSVALNWTAYTNAIGYNIYEGAAANALTTLLGSTTSATTFTDTGAAGTTVSAPLTDVVTITSPTLPRFTYGGP
jgi:hypothetical protein